MHSVFRLLTLCALGSLGCVRTPPGTSVEVALAQKAALVRLPPAPQQPTAARSRGGSPGAIVEPALPSADKTARVAEAFTRGQFCMKAGKDPEAIAAFQEAVKIDPTFSDAWQALAALYEKAGDEKLALNAFREAKKVTQN